MINKKNGFTLLETIISLAVFLILTLTVSNLLFISITTNNKIFVKKELLENARIAMEVISTRIQIADEVYITNYPNSNSVKELRLVRYEDNKVIEDKFTYTKGSSSSGNKYNRIDFGGNELAVYINDFTIDVEDSILEISIVTDDRIDYSNGKVVEPISISRKINVESKKIIEN